MPKPSNYNPLFNHAWVDEDGTVSHTWPFGSEKQSLEKRLEDDESFTNDFEIDDAQEFEISLDVYAHITDGDTTESWYPNAIRGDDSSETERLMWCLDQTAFDLYTQCTNIPNPRDDDFWVLNICLAVGRLEGVLKAFELAERNNYLDSDVVRNQINLPPAIWITLLMFAFNTMVELVGWSNDDQITRMGEQLNFNLTNTLQNFIPKEN